VRVLPWLRSVPPRLNVRPWHAKRGIRDPQTLRKGRMAQRRHRTSSTRLLAGDVLRQRRHGRESQPRRCRELAPLGQWPGEKDRFHLAVYLGAEG
jgi:hypothetical protein